MRRSQVYPCTLEKPRRKAVPRRLALCLLGKGLGLVHSVVRLIVNWVTIFMTYLSGLHLVMAKNSSFFKDNMEESYIND